MCVTGTFSEPTTVSYMRVMYFESTTYDHFDDYVYLNGYTGVGTETLCYIQAVPKALIEGGLYVGDNVVMYLYDEAGNNVASADAWL